MAFRPTPNLVLALKLGIFLFKKCLIHSVWSLIACLTCGVIAAIIPLVIPSCQDVEHTCPHCILLFPAKANIVGGFLMARYRRGVNDAKVYRVNGDYIPVNREYSPVEPLPQFPQHSGVIDGKN